MNKLHLIQKPLVLITMGDPAGIGPEIILKTIKTYRSLHQFFIFGDDRVLKKACELVRFPKGKIGYRRTFQNRITVLGTQMEKGFSEKRIGKIYSYYGAMSIRWIEEAVQFSKDLIKRKIPHAVVTAPINKESAHLGGFAFSGHTDYLSHLYSSPETSMMFYSRKCKVILATVHCSLSKAISSLNEKIIYQKIVHAHTAMKKWGVQKPEILVSGLNPHSGESGAFGNEEIQLIEPAIKAARKKRIDVTGPYPPDTIFLKAIHNPSACVVAMYHDQGLIPFKLLAFSSGVNVTVGLPVIRTSPDHGTAFDIAWKGVADPRSFREAVSLALRTAQQ